MALGLGTLCQADGAVQVMAGDSWLGRGVTTPCGDCPPCGLRAPEWMPGWPGGAVWPRGRSLLARGVVGRGDRTRGFALLQERDTTGDADREKEQGRDSYRHEERLCGCHADANQRWFRKTSGRPGAPRAPLRRCCAFRREIPTKTLTPAWGARLARTVRPTSCAREPRASSRAAEARAP